MIAFGEAIKELAEAHQRYLRNDFVGMNICIKNARGWIDSIDKVD